MATPFPLDAVEGVYTDDHFVLRVVWRRALGLCSGRDWDVVLASHRASEAGKFPVHLRRASVSRQRERRVSRPERTPASLSLEPRSMGKEASRELLSGSEPS